MLTIFVIPFVNSDLQPRLPMNLEPRWITHPPGQHPVLEIRIGASGRESTQKETLQVTSVTRRFSMTLTPRSQAHKVRTESVPTLVVRGNVSRGNLVHEPEHSRAL